ncbi:IclR family transcriptional regulator [Achromobacter sp. HZ01]|uniref:IclR family transcriptional regulator n=1 Tax=Achromobacter sp. HZ01 TaxID=1416886 RepID=UPI000DC52BC5|nr:IclR family transcriptional regulator [Achromobacter sp. HZ01]RAP63474.1 IclR family transcriptional regulator [Achromobacter sp. HZ01]
MPNLIPATGRTLAVFEVFAREKRELSNSDMARLLSLADSSCSDLLYTLHSLGYLMRTPKTRQFYPTGRLFEMACQFRQNDPMSAVAQEAVEQLVERTNETAFFGVHERLAVKVAAALPSRRPLRYILDVGDRVAVHASAFGKALLGLLPPQELRAEVARLNLKAVTPHTITDPGKLIANIEAGRRRGWYDTRSEGAEGVTALAVSGWLGGHAVSLSLAGPTERVDKHHAEYLQALRDVRGAILDGQPAAPFFPSK